MAATWFDKAIMNVCKKRVEMPILMLGSYTRIEKHTDDCMRSGCIVMQETWNDPYLSLAQLDWYTGTALGEVRSKSSGSPTVRC